VEPGVVAVVGVIVVPLLKRVSFTLSHKAGGVKVMTAAGPDPPLIVPSGVNRPMVTSIIYFDKLPELQFAA
jgi:hypothetical protein